MKLTGQRVIGRFFEWNCRHWLEWTIGFTVVVFVALIGLIYWGPTANQMDEMAIALYRQRDLGPRLEWLLRASIAWREMFLGRDNPEVARGLQYLARYYDRCMQGQKVEPLLTRAVMIFENNYRNCPKIDTYKNQSYLDLLGSLNDLAAFYVNRQDYHKAAKVLCREASFINQMNRVTRSEMQNFEWLAQGLVSHVSYDEVPKLKRPKIQESWQEDLLSTVRSTQWLHGKSPEETVSQAIWDKREARKIIVDFSMALGQYKDAEEALLVSMKLAKSAKVDWDPDLMQMAVIKEALGKYSDAENCYKTVIAGKGIDPYFNPLTAEVALQAYANMQRHRGLVQEASALDKQALDFKTSNHLQ